jgi:hypothetical protein
MQVRMWVRMRVRMRAFVMLRMGRNLRLQRAFVMLRMGRNLRLQRGRVYALVVRLGPKMQVLFVSVLF